MFGSCIFSSPCRPLATQTWEHLVNYLKVQSQCMFCLKHINPEQRCSCSAFEFTWFLQTDPLQRGLTHCFRLQDRKLHWRPKDGTLENFFNGYSSNQDLLHRFNSHSSIANDSLSSFFTCDELFN